MLHVSSTYLLLVLLLTFPKAVQVFDISTTHQKIVMTPTTVSLSYLISRASSTQGHCFHADGAVSLHWPLAWGQSTLLADLSWALASRHGTEGGLYSRIRHWCSGTAGCGAEDGLDLQGGNKHRADGYSH